MKKHILVTHTDLDGIAAAVVFLKTYQEYSFCFEVHYCEIDEVDNTLKDIIAVDFKNDSVENLYIVDVTPKDKDVIATLDNYQKKTNIVLLDHHETAASRFVDYNWATIDTTQCASKAFYQYLNNNGYQISYCLTKYIDAVDASDRWVKDDMELFNYGRQHSLLLRSLGRNEYIDNQLFKTDVSAFLESELLVLDILESEQKRYVNDKIKSIVKFNCDDVSLAIVFCDRCISEIAEELRNRHTKEFAAVVGINLSNRTIRIRSIDENFDSGKFSKKFSVRGGGHYQSGGFHIDDDNKINNFLSTLFKKLEE